MKASIPEKTRDDNCTCFDDHAALLFPAVDPRALALGDTDPDPLELAVVAGKDAVLEGVNVALGDEVADTEAVVSVTADVGTEAVDEMGNGAVVIRGTGVTLEVSETVLNPEPEVDRVPPVIANTGLMLPESPNTISR